MQNVDVPDKPYDFVHTSDMVDGGYDSDYLLGKLFNSISILFHKIIVFLMCQYSLDKFF